MTRKVASRRDEVVSTSSVGRLVPLAGRAGAGARTGAPVSAEPAVAGTGPAVAGLRTIALRPALTSVRVLGKQSLALGDRSAISPFPGLLRPGGGWSTAALAGRSAPRYQDADRGHAGCE